MKKNKLKKIILLSTAFVFLLLSCKKEQITQEEPEKSDLPPLTHTGANTFGCYIDGVPFVANKGESMLSTSPVSGSFDEEIKLLKIQGTRHSELDNIDALSFKLIVDIDKGYYSMDVKTDHFQGYIDVGGGNCKYYHNKADKGICVITCFDETKNIISGTFSMNLINDKCTSKRILKITDGRFDFHY